MHSPHITHHPYHISTRYAVVGLQRSVLALWRISARRAVTGIRTLNILHAILFRRRWRRRWAVRLETLDRLVLLILLDSGRPVLVRLVLLIMLHGGLPIALSVLGLRARPARESTEAAGEH